MLDINVTESENMVFVTGLLNELDIRKGTTSDGRDWISGTANIRVDQEINGVLTENIIPVRMFSMRLKKDGTENKIYTRIDKYAEQFTSAAAAEDITDASYVTISGASIEENIWIDQTTKEERTNFQISGNFMNKKRDADKEEATFRLSGIVLKVNDEIKNDEPTGRIIVKFGVVGYAGKVNIINLIAEGNAKAHIETNWQEGDTVKVTGRINMVQKVESYKEEQGFGEPIERLRTISVRELIVTGGSASGLEEDLSYDADAVKQGLMARQERIQALKNAPAKTNKPVARNNDFGF